MKEVGSTGMKLIVRIDSGVDSGKRVWITDGQNINVGRTDWCELSITDDRQMDEVHFQLSCDDRYCTLKKVSENSAVYVNGNVADDQKLVHGDVIRAGQTEFTVMIDADGQDVASNVELVHAERRTAANQFEYYALEMKNGLMKYYPFGSGYSAKRFAKMLHKQMSVYLIVNATRSNMNLRTDQLGVFDISKVVPLPNDVTGDELRLLTAGSRVDRFQIIEEQWSNDTVTVLFSSREPHVFLNWLRRTTTLISRPSILRDRLLKQNDQFIRQWFEAISAIMLPDHTRSSWELFVDGHAKPIWKQMGLPNGPINSTAKRSKPATAMDSNAG